MGTGVQLVSRVFSLDPARRNVSKILITLTDGTIVPTPTKIRRINRLTITLLLIGNNNRGIDPATAIQRLFDEISGISALVIGTRNKRVRMKNFGYSRPIVHRRSWLRNQQLYTAKYVILPKIFSKQRKALTLIILPQP